MDVSPGWQSCYVAITNSNLQANEATSPLAGSSFAELQGSGGAIWTNSPLLWIHNSTLIGNYAATIGGAVFYITRHVPSWFAFCFSSSISVNLMQVLISLPAKLCDELDTILT